MAKYPRAPLAPAAFPDLPVIAGVSFATAEAGVRYAGRRDVMLALCAPGSAVAGVFTRSATRSANVLDCQAKIGGDGAEGAAFVINSGNSNAFTGKAGEGSVAEISDAAARQLGLPAARLFTSSTGVIGERLPHDRITAKLAELAAALDPAGIAKGSGMIAPDMATMLVYIFTDARIARADLQSMLSRLTDKTFNCITVDSDTSTSDTLLMAATGASGADVTGSAAFEEALHGVMRDLAHQVVKDGEGATKFVTVRVTGAASDADARTHALSIANSPLIKTAVAGEDPNWGRVVMAVGKSGAAADRDRLSIRFGDILVAAEGWVAPDYTEAAGAAYMKRPEIDVTVDLGLGDGTATIWTCDLTKRYIEINADYRS
jgi:glutamate N-acetyltransferase/amino-acid N-acetyltransferase